MIFDECLLFIQFLLKLLVKEFCEQDNIVIVIYVGDFCIVLFFIFGSYKVEINVVIDLLDVEGSINGGVGLELVYQQVMKGFIKGGINCILLVIDGDFNVGIDDLKLIELMVKKQWEFGVILLMFGVGNSNYNEVMMV